MTAPSPERLRELIAEYWDLAYAEGAESRSHDTPAGAAMRVSAEIDKDISALLQQLAEREAEVAKWRERSETNERLRCEVMALFNGAASDLRAAERAREEAQKAVIAAIPTNWCDPLLTGPNAVIRGSGEYNGLDIERLLLAIQQRVVAAFLAANK